MSPGMDHGARALHGLETAAWTACVGLAILAIVHTLGADFPARPRALAGELVALAAAIGLALAALRRVLRTEQARVGLGAIFVGLRVGLGVPAFLFVLVSAAAGFAA